MTGQTNLKGECWDSDYRAFASNPTIQNYLRMRKLYPDREPKGWWFSGVEPLSSMAEELAIWGISVADLAAAMDADHQAIERVAIRILELLAEREELLAKGETHIVSRGAAVSNQLVDYLIALLLEGMEEYDEPASIGALNFLIRERLGGPIRAQHAAYLKAVRKQAIVTMYVSAKRVPEFGDPSLRQIANVLGINVSSASKLFAPGEFDRLVEVEMARSDHSGPLADTAEVEKEELYRALHRNVREQQP